jgi:hypothetical protein
MKKRGESSEIREFCLALQRIGEDSLLKRKKTVFGSLKKKKVS